MSGQGTSEMGGGMEEHRDDRAGEIRDVLGIGFGPAGIALAAAIHEEAPGLDCLFLESREETAWQPGMLLSGADTQHHPVRDLATLRNPRSRFTFVNYLHEQGRLLPFLNVPSHFPLRRDYARYVRWAAGELSGMAEYGRRATGISAVTGPVPHYVVTTACGRRYRGRALVMCTGRTPYVPDLFVPHLGARVFHSNDYLWRLAALRRSRPGPLTVAVVGASQSAAEVALDLHSAGRGDRVLAVMRGFGYRLKDTSPFTEEAFLPEFTDDYFRASRERKVDLDTQLRPSNYSSVDRDVLESLYLRHYEDQLEGEGRLRLYRNQDVRAAAAGADHVVLTLEDRGSGVRSRVTADAVVVATGFRDLGPGERDERCPELLEPLHGNLAVDEHGTLAVERDYAVPARLSEVGFAPVFLNGLCESTHGLGDAGSFSLLSLRARTLLEGIRSRLGPPGNPFADAVAAEGDRMYGR
jgi:L-ornithine N5-oxygenase